jgi:hypothetical protein
MIPHSDLIFQGDPLTDHCLDVRVDHDPVELRMMEVFQRSDSKSLGSHTFMFIIVDVPCSKFKSTDFIDFLSNKHKNACFCLRRLHDWLHWRVDYVDLSRLTDHLAAWLHWSSEYVDHGSLDKLPE